MSANLEVFESLQSNANAAMGMSEIGVFNSPDDVKRIRRAKSAYVRRIDKALNAVQEAKKQYRQVYDEVVANREAQAPGIMAAKEAGDLNPLEVFKAEYNQILDLIGEVHQKETQFNDFQL